MPPRDNPGSVHTSSEGGTVGSYPGSDSSEFSVAPATSGESNALNLNLFLAAYACVTDMRFKFDSSFVLPGVQAEMSALASLRKSNPLIMGAPISIFGHADPSFQGNFEVGSSTAQSGDDYNKTLSGRRAIAIYALLIRDPGLWDTLFTNHLGADLWGQDSIRIMLGQTGQPDPDDNTVVNIANNSGQRQQLFLKYMNSLCGDLKLDKSADFLARNAGADQKGDVQGCSRFNPLLLFSSEDEARFKQAFANNDQPTLRGDRDVANAVNRRVMILIFKKGSQVLPSKWPCPSYKDGTAGCIKRFWSDGNTRRSTHSSGADTKFEDTHATFACRFYQRISGEKSPCNSTSPPPPLPCNPTISIGHVIRGNPYVPRNANAADGMPDSVPPTKTYEVEVVVANWTGECSGKKFDISIGNTGGDNGSATVSPAEITGNGTFKVTVTGVNQTKSGHAGKLTIQAKLDGNLKAESAGFSVCAHPINWTDAYAGDIDEPQRVGVLVQDGWDSDSGTFADLDKAEISEVVEYDAPVSPPYAGGGGAHNSGYLVADALTQDEHTIGRPAAGPAAPWERRQLSIFKCHRCGVTDKTQPNSGLKIVHEVFQDAGNWKHRVKKFGAKVTSRGYTSDAGVANVTSPNHDLP